MGQSRPLFLFIFIFSTCYNLNWKKRRWCAWESNPGRQDGRRKRIHSATATPPYIITFSTGHIFDRKYYRRTLFQPDTFSTGHFFDRTYFWQEILWTDTFSTGHIFDRKYYRRTLFWQDIFLTGHIIDRTHYRQAFLSVQQCLHLNK